MKSKIHELRPNKLFRVSKKVFMLAALVLGTTAMVNAQQKEPAKAAPAKEVKAVKKAEKKMVKAEKKVEAATPAKPAAPAKK
ncbi:hypothetical protein [Flavobacterium phycosphaerae]|uniref:hypothetical protein n=1 Tax=Flavobacterium phycosphaerae TaxID=2697515 RepID=UPI001F374A57|nr:hypothetical protein [Flavobacterium phycosphaerae]